MSALPQDVRFRVTFFDQSGSDPIWGDATDYEITESSFGTAGWDHPRPYLKVPKSFFQTEVDFLRGSSKLGTIQFEVLDVRLDADDQTSGIITKEIQRCVGSEVIFERYFDDVDEWRTIFRGRVDEYAVSTSEVVVYEFNTTDPRGYEEDTQLFAENYTCVVFPEFGPAFPYGEFPARDGYFLEQAPSDERVGARFQTEVDGQTVYHWSLPIDRDTGRDLQPYKQLDEATGTFRGLAVRWQFLSDDPLDPDDWTVVRDSIPVRGLTSCVLRPGDQRGGGAINKYRVFFSSLDPNDIPTVVNGTVRFQVLAGYTTEETPYFWDNGTLGDLLWEISQGLHTTAPPREQYDPVALEAFRANTPRGRFVAKEPQDRRKWVEKNIYQATRHAPAFDAQMRIRPTPWKAPTLLDDVPVLSRDVFRPPGQWTHSTDDATNTIAGSYIEENIGDQQFDTEIKTKKFLGFIPTGVEEKQVSKDLTFFERFEENKVNFEVEDADSVARVGQKIIRYEPETLRVIGTIESRPVGGDTQDPEAVKQAQAFIEQAKSRYLPKGAPRLRIDAKLSDPTVRDITPGDFVIAEVPWHPDYGTLSRNARRYMQCYGYADREVGWRTLYLEDVGTRSQEVQDPNGPDPTVDCLSGSDGIVVGVSSRLNTVRLFESDGNIVLSGCPGPVTLRILGVGGGGGGGTAPGSTATCGGGGGAGGVDGAGDTPSNPFKEVTVTAPATIPVTVGAGGGQGVSGGDSIVWVDVDGNVLDPLTDSPDDAIIRALGGGHGGSGVSGAPSSGASGGSGGGAGALRDFTAGGSPVTAAQGNSGGGGFGTLGFTLCDRSAGGGGGSYYGDGDDSDASNEGGQGGPGGGLAFWGIILGGGGGGGTHEKWRGSNPNNCAEDNATPGIPGSAGYGAGGGGGAGGIAGTPGSDGCVMIEYVGGRLELPVPDSDEKVNDDDDQVIEVDVPAFPDVTPDGYRLKVEYAISATEPDPDAGEWKLLGYLEEPGTLYTPQVPTGQNVWVRKSAEADNIPPSSFPDAVQVQATPTPGLLNLLVLEEDGTVTVTWTPNPYCGALTIATAVLTEDEAESDTLTFTPEPIGEIDAVAVREHVISRPLGEGETMVLEIETFPGVNEIEGNNATLFTFDGPDGPFPGTDTDWEFIKENTLDIADSEISGNAYLLDSNTINTFGVVYVGDDIPLSTERFVQVVFGTTGGEGGIAIGLHKDGTDTGYSGWHMRANRLGGFFEGGINRMDNGNPNGSPSASWDVGSDPAGGVNYEVQFYHRDGLQEAALSDGGGAANEFKATTSGTDYDGTPGSFGIIHAGTNNRQTYNDLLVMNTKFITVDSLPTGWKVRVRDSGGSVVNEGTESGGTVELDMSVFSGDTTVFVPTEGWEDIQVLDDSDVVQFTYNETGIFPGLTASWNAGTGTFDGIVGDNGRTYYPQIERVVTTIATQAQAEGVLNRLIFTDDLDLLLDDDLNVIIDDEE